MPYGRLTVGDLRKAIEGLPDNSPVLVKPRDQEEFSSHDRIRRRDHETGQITVLEAKPAKVWNHNTRELHNAYKANDDRYDQNSILLIELGGFSP